MWPLRDGIGWRTHREDCRVRIEDVIAATPAGQYEAHRARDRLETLREQLRRYFQIAKIEEDWTTISELTPCDIRTVKQGSGFT